MYKPLLLLFFISSVFLDSAEVISQEIKYIEVSAFGEASVKEEAIKVALAQAISKVNGTAIDAKNILKKTTVSSNVDGEKKFASNKEMIREMKDATRGVVSSYEINNVIDLNNGLYRAEVTAKVAQLSLTSGSRKKIAVLPMRVEVPEVKLSSLNNTAQQLSRKFTQAVEDKIVSSRRFTVLDREYVEQTLGEKSKILDNPLLPMEEVLRLSQNLVADLVVVGTVQNISYSLQTKEFKTLNKTFTSPYGNVALNFKIIDVATGQTKFSGTVMQRFSSENFLSIYPDANLPDPTLAIAELVSLDISQDILTAIYPLIIVSVEGQSVTLNQGGDLISTGDKYEVFQKGEKLIDPYTKEPIGYQEKYVADITIKKVNNKFSTATVEANIDLAQYFAPKRLVCRLKNKGLSSYQTQAEQDKKEIDDFFSNEDGGTDEFEDDDWQ